MPGEDYIVQEAEHNGYLRLHTPLVVKPGGHRDLGDLKMGPKR